MCCHESSRTVSGCPSGKRRLEIKFWEIEEVRCRWGGEWYRRGKNLNIWTEFRNWNAASQGHFDLVGKGYVSAKVSKLILGKAA